jgi:hypothetical protein
MAIDLTVISIQRPDLDVCDRLARLALSSIDPPIDLSGVSAFEVAPEHHEFTDAHVVMLGAQTREPETFVAMLVVAHAVASLYGGEVVDESSFFPSITSGDLLRRCMGAGLMTAEELWQTLRSSGP